MSRRRKRNPDSYQFNWPYMVIDKRHAMRDLGITAERYDELAEECESEGFMVVIAERSEGLVLVRFSVPGEAGRAETDAQAAAVFTMGGFSLALGCSRGAR